MAKEEKIIRCSICETIVELESGWNTQVIKHKNGILWGDFGYSIGGWGHRQNFMHSFSGEICDECFNAIKIKINELNETIKKRKGCNKDGICIYGTPNNKTEGNKMFDLQPDELQPKRHKGIVLRLLSSFSQ